MVAPSLSSVRARLTPTRRPGGLAMLGSLLTLGVFVVVGGAAGVAGGVGVAVAVLLGGPLVGFIVGHALVILVTATPTGVEVILAEFGLGALLVAAVSDDDSSITTHVLVALAFVGIAAFLVVVTELLEPVWGVTAVFVGTLLLSGYILHRYELVALDLVSEADDE